MVRQRPSDSGCSVSQTTSAARSGSSIPCSAKTTLASVRSSTEKNFHSARILDNSCVNCWLRVSTATCLISACLPPNNIKAALSRQIVYAGPSRLPFSHRMMTVRPGIHRSRQTTCPRISHGHHRSCGKCHPVVRRQTFLLGDGAVNQPSCSSICTSLIISRSSRCRGRTLPRARIMLRFR